MSERDFLGTGIAFPPRIGPSGGFVLSTGEQNVQDSMWIILATSLGERQMLPTFGAGLHDVVFMPNQTMTHTMLGQRVRDALTKWEPRIDVVDVRVEPDLDDPNKVLIRVDYRLRATNGFGNLVFPYYLSEGKGV